MITPRILSVLVVATAALPLTALAQSPPPPGPCILADVRLSDDEDAPRVSIVVREGRVAAVLDAGAELPAGLRQIDGEGALALPAFIDGFTTRECDQPEIAAERGVPLSTVANVLAGMRVANRKGLAPSFRSLDAIDLGEAEREEFRKHGFGTLHSAPSGELLAGRGAALTTSELALRERILHAEVGHNATFQASGSGYPSTLMAYIAHLRQFFLDAQRHEQLQTRASAGQPDRRPPFDADLDAVLPLLRGEGRLLCFAQRARDFERWLRLADQFGFEVAFAGGLEAWRVADLLAERGCAVVLTLDWGDEVDDPDAEDDEDATEPEDDSEGEPVGETDSDLEDEADPAPEDEDQSDSEWDYSEPVAVERERRRRWEERRDGALRLHEAGVRIAFGSGDDQPGELVERVRELVDAGLPAEVALAGLTGAAADVLGIADRVGRIAAGQYANIALWSGSPVTGKAHLAWLVVDGEVFEFDPDEADESDGVPDEGLDVSGAWEVTFESDQASDATMSLEMSASGAVTGRFVTSSPINDEKVTGELEGRLSGSTLRLRGSLSFGAFEAGLRFEGTLEGGTIRGESGWRFSGGEQTSDFEATRTPDASRREVIR
ncbi:MAG TPA: amidohydrolase family protein [Planctomycetota bacterium]|nr:amidohydrolase family protein [Planctomycetota bacterium]